MRRASLVSCLGALLVLLPAPAATAMGFGRTATATTLGQRLDFVAHVWLDGDETLARECVAAEVMIGDRRLGSDDVRVALESAREGAGSNVRVSTRIAIDEPVVTVDLSVGCTSQMARRFVAFIDPPMLRLASASATESDTAAPRRDVSTSASAVDIARAADSSRRFALAGADPTPASAARTSRRVGRRADHERRFDAALALLPSEPRPVAVASARRPARAGLGGRREAAVGARPRLMLEAASAFAIAPPAAADARAATRTAGATAPAVTSTEGAAPSVGAPSLAAISVAATSVAATSPAATALAASSVVTSSAAAPGSAEAASAALAGDSTRSAQIEELEAGLARIRSESQAQQKTLGALQARLREAESARYANGLVYALAAAMVFFALLAAAFWALRPRQRGRARWFDPHTTRARKPAGVAAPASAPRVAETATPAVSQHPSQWRESEHGLLPVVTAPATIGGLEVTTVLAPRSRYAQMAEADASANAGAADAPRASSLTMGELIDLEQQAEFFVVLGQDEAAVSLLAAHVQDGAASPLPFLELLEIHQRRGDRDAYEDVRDAYSSRFDASAPEWSTALHLGRALDAYPQTIARLQALWPTPMQAMETLDALLFRRGEDDQEFDLPAYRDLLFLSSVARELGGHVETGFGPIDLFLPLDGASADPSSSPDSAFAVDVDISGWHDDTEAEEPAVGRRSAGRRSAG